jgi:hypothetical protein
LTLQRGVSLPAALGGGFPCALPIQMPDFS